MVAKGAFVTSTALGLANEETSSMHYEDQARRVMDRIALTVMGSDRDTLLPAIESEHTSDIRYSFSLGLEDGVVVWSDPEEIRLSAAGDAVEWLGNPGTPEERQRSIGSGVR